MAVNAFMIIVAIVLSVIIFICAGIMVIYFQHPDDQNVAWIPKIIVVISLFVACANVLLLPFDVISAQTGGGINMELLWSISYWVTAILCLAVIPFAYFFYENDTGEDEDTSGCCGLIPYWNSQLCEGIKWSLGFILVFSIIFMILYIPFPYAKLPINTRKYQFHNAQRSPNRDLLDETIPFNCENESYGCIETSEIIQIKVTITTYAIALLAFIGWFLFVLFAGTGLPALPWDLFNEWKYRPKPIPVSTYAEEKVKLHKRATLLKEAGKIIKDDELNSLGNKSLSRKDKREMAATLHRFENAVYLLKRDFYHLQVAYSKKGGNPIGYWLKLLMSIVGGSISLAWIIHICVFMLPKEPAHPFLNNLFIGLSIPGFPLFGVIAYGFYSFWLLLCVVKGNFRFGLRVPCCRAFPMEINGTMMNSFLANCWLILISSLVVVQFCALAFPVYARNSTINLLFGYQVRYIQFFTYFFDNNVFIWALLACSLLAIVALIFCPKNDAIRIEDELADIMNDKKDITKRQLQMVTKNNKK